MSDLPPPPPPPAPPPARPAWEPPAPHRPNRVPAAIGVAAGMVLLIGALAGVVVALGHHGPGHPSHWDPRVADLARFVEQERGLDFRHPVYVDFLSPKEYTKVTTSDAKDLTQKDRDQLNEAAGLLRAVGLVEGNLDLFKASNELNDAGTLAFYDNDSKRVRVRGTKMTPALRVTLVHELTHADQDQHFDLNQHLKDAKTSGQESAYRSVVEGDAERIEDLYVKQLSAADKAAYDKESAAQSSPDTPALKDVPDALIAFFDAPYALGRPFVDSLDATEGNAGVDRALRVPPVSEEQLLDPIDFGSGDPLEVPTPKLAKGETHLDDGDFGAMSLYLVLAARIDAHQALVAADGWDGDSYVQFRRHGTVCIRADFRGDKASATDALATALDEWAKAMGGDVSVRRVRAAVELEACDPGKAATGHVATQPSDALGLPVTRAYIYAASVAQAPTPRVAWCYADRLVGELSVAEVNDPTGAVFKGQSFQARAAAAAQACRG